MKYNRGNKVVYVPRERMKDRYAWKLNEYETYEVVGSAFDKLGIEILYCLKDWKGTETSWYEENDLKSIKEIRNLKLKQLKNKNYGN